MCVREKEGRREGVREGGRHQKRGIAHEQSVFMSQRGVAGSDTVSDAFLLILSRKTREAENNWTKSR